MGRLRTFKRLGAHAHRDSSRPGTFKRPGAGVAIRAPATQTLPPVAGEGNLPTAIPHLPAMESLSPRLRRLVNDQCGSEAKTLAEVMVQEGVTARQAAACHADSGAQFAEKLGSANIGLQSVWRLADVEFDAHLAVCARVERAAHVHTPRVQNPPQQVTRTSKPIAKKQRCEAARVGWQHAESAEQRNLDRAIQQALELQETMRPWSTRLQNFDAAGIPQPTQETLLRAVIQLKARVAATIPMHLRSVSRLQAWADKRPLQVGTLRVDHIATWLLEESNCGATVPRLVAGLKRVQRVYLLPWDLKDPLIQAVEAKSTAQAVKQRQQATPYEHKHVTDLMARFRDLEDCEERFAVGFLLLLAFGVLHFQDLHRCKSVKLSRDSIYGTCWRSKNKRGQFPWAALREPNDGLDFGQMMLVLIERYVGFVEGEHGSLRSWLWPHMTITSEGLKITTLPRQGSYGNCLRVQSWIHEKLRHPEQFTLHSPKFYMPTLAEQVGLSLEERNQMCHWSPMPLVYDQSRCCAELVAKDKIRKALRAGFAPGASFELPKPGVEQKQQLAAAVANVWGKQDARGSPVQRLAAAQPQKWDCSQGKSRGTDALQFCAQRGSRTL